MRKIYVLDTNVLIHDPKCIYNFEDNEVVVPIYVIEEIDKLKSKNNTSHSARMVSRQLEKIRKKGSLSKGVELKNDILFRVELENNIDLLPNGLKRDVIDNYIISSTLTIKKKNPDKKVIIVSKDINMRIKASILGLEVQDYKTDRVEDDVRYDGIIDIEVNDAEMKNLEKSGKIDISSLNLPKEVKITPNIFARLKNNNKSVLTKNNDGKLKKLVLGDTTMWGLKARNEEQRCAVELLMDDNIKVVSMIGTAGTGKTLLAIASALEQVVERKKYNKILIARPVIPMGKDLGYLPGSEKDKMQPWLQPIYDNIDFLSNINDRKSGENVVKGLESMGLLKVEPITYIRGRSIPNGYIIIDEAQNLTPLEIKTIVTRVSVNTKIIFTGDPTQIDNTYLDKNSNGLTYLADRLKNEKIAGHITLVKGERSEVSKIASELL